MIVDVLASLAIVFSILAMLFARTDGIATWRPWLTIALAFVFTIASLLTANGFIIPRVVP